MNYVRALGPCSSPETVNLTEWWRKDQNGTNVAPIGGSYACDEDLLANPIWFRYETFLLIE